MQDLFEIFRHYPLLSTFLILGPLMGGAIGTYLGYDNLTTRLQNERQQDRIENRANKIGDELHQLSVLSLLKISTGLREAGDFDEPAVPSRSW